MDYETIKMIMAEWERLLKIVPVTHHQYWFICSNFWLARNLLADFEEELGLLV